MARSWTFLTLQIWTCAALLRVRSVHSVDTKTANTQQRHIAHRVRIDWGLHLTQTYPGSFLRFVTKDDGWGVWQCSHVYIFVTGAKQHSPSSQPIGLRTTYRDTKVFSIQSVNESNWRHSLMTRSHSHILWIVYGYWTLKMLSTSKLSYPDCLTECSELAFITSQVTWLQTDQLPSVPSVERSGRGSPVKQEKLAIINLGPGFDSNWVKLHDASQNCTAFKIYRSIILIKISNWKMLNAYYYHF